MSLCHFEIPASENSPEPSKDGEPDNDPAEFRKLRFRTGNLCNCLIKSESGVLGDSRKIDLHAQFNNRCNF